MFSLREPQVRKSLWALMSSHTMSESVIFKHLPGMHNIINQVPIPAILQHPEWMKTFMGRSISTLNEIPKMFELI